MKQSIFKFFLCFSMFWITPEICAQDAEGAEGVEEENTEVIDGMTWYLKKKEAFEIAREQNKYVFLLWGRDACEKCEALRVDVARCPVQTVIAKHYILWYSDCDVYDREHSDVTDYLSSFPKGIIPLPVTCIINPADEKKAYGLQNGDYDPYELAELLDNTVGNEPVVHSEKVGVYVYENRLTVKNEVAREVVRIYTVTGALVDSFLKTTYEIDRNTLAYPIGMLVVTGSSGWTRKIVIK